MSTTLFKNCTGSITGRVRHSVGLNRARNVRLDCWNEQYDHSDVHNTTGAAPAAIPQFSALSVPNTCRCTKRERQRGPRTATVESQRSSAQQRCAYLSRCSNWNNHHSVDELNEAPKTAGTRAACSQGRPRSTTSASVAAASICIPPWPGGVFR